MTVNGVQRDWQEGLTLLRLLQEQGHDPARVAALKNGQVVPRDSFGETVLERDDALELVSFVGGG